MWAYIDLMHCIDGFWWACLWWYVGFWKKSSSLSSEGICEVLRFYPEVCVQRVSCLSMWNASSMLVSEFIVCGQTSSFRYCNDGFRDISLICSRAFLVDLHLMVCLCFLVRVHPLHWKAFVKFWGFTLRFVYKDCVVCPWKLQIQCYSQVSWCVWAHAVLCSELINSRWVFLKEIVPCIWRHCEVHVLCVLSVPKNCKFNGVPRFHGMPTYIVLYTALMLVPHSYNGRWVFLRGVYFLHLKGVCEALRVYFEPRDSLRVYRKCHLSFHRTCKDNAVLRFHVCGNTLFYICIAIDAGTTFCICDSCMKAMRWRRTQWALVLFWRRRQLPVLNRRDSWRTG